MNLTALLAHKEPLVRSLAQKAERYKAQYERGGVTRTEYEALCRQLVDLKALEDDAYTAEQRLALQQAVQILRSFLGVFL